MAAVVGVLGGLGGAFVGGSVANQGQEERFESEREAARHDLRQDAYANYLQAAYGLLLKLQLKADGVAVNEAELFDRLDATVAAQATVSLLANPEFQDLTDDLTNALARDEQDTSIELLLKFIDLAKKDIAKTGQ